MRCMGLVLFVTSVMLCWTTGQPLRLRDFSTLHRKGLRKKDLFLITTILYPLVLQEGKDL